MTSTDTAVTTAAGVFTTGCLTTGCLAQVTNHRLACTAEETALKTCSDNGVCQKITFGGATTLQCRCYEGFRGQNCELIDFDFSKHAPCGDIQSQIAIYCAITAATVLLLVAIFIIIYKRCSKKSVAPDMIETGQSRRMYNQITDGKPASKTSKAKKSTQQKMEEDEVFEVNEEAPLTPK